MILPFFIKSARKPWAFKPADEWPLGAKRSNPAEPGCPGETPAFRPESFISVVSDFSSVPSAR